MSNPQTEDNKTRVNRTYARRLVLLASIDGAVSEAERMGICQACLHVGVSTDDLRYALENPDQDIDVDPTDIETQAQHLQGLIAVLGMDSQSYEKKLDFIKGIADNFGISVNVVDELVAALDGVLSTSMPVALCSACMSEVVIDEIRVLPWWNDSVDDFLTTFRCDTCLPASLAETKARIASADDEVVTQFCSFMSRHGFEDQAESIASLPHDAAIARMVEFIDLIESKKIQLSP